LNVVVWFGLVIAPVVWFLQLVVHETSHTIVPKLNGCKVSIRPWPGRNERRFFFAYSTWQCTRVLSRTAQALTYVFPRLVNIVTMAVLFWVRPESAWANTIVVAWVIAATVDFGFNTLGIFRNPEYPNDAWETAKFRGVESATYLRIEAIVITALFGVLAATRIFA
jgi:hypothetical protein